MTRIAGRAFAFCIFLIALFASEGVLAGRTTPGENIAYYNKRQVQRGATTLPLAAQLSYKEAVFKIHEGKLDDAVSKLEEAISFDPGFADAYLTLSKVKIRQYDPDALYFFVLGCRALVTRFSTLSLLVVNVLVIAALMLMILTTVACVSFGVRYVPFLAHKVAETLQVRFNAALPRTTAFLIILLPFALFPGFITGVCLLVVMTWHFMQRREKLMVAALFAPLVLLGVFSSSIKRINPLADPKSFTHLAAKSMYSAGDPSLIQAVKNLSIDGLDPEKHNVLGLLYYRQNKFDTAAMHFLRAIELQSDNAMSYINLGNVYYSQGLYEKALEGYRKAAQIDGDDAVGQYNLAQAYIKTLLMAESSKALRKASAEGIDRVKNSYASMSKPSVQVYAKTFTNVELLRICRIEGLAHDSNFISQILKPLTRFSAWTCAWLLLGSLMLAVILSRMFKNKNLTFQCSNCGQLTCDNCCEDMGATYLCESCAAVIDGVSSEKVIDALLRQRRHRVVVRRRKAIRILTLWVPGMRDIYYGKIVRGAVVTLVFALCIIQLLSRGYIVKDWNTIATMSSLWKSILPAAGIVITYLITVLTKRYVEVRNYRAPSISIPHKDSTKDDGLTPKNLTA